MVSDARWLCMLSGTFQPYDQPVSDEVEAAYQSGAAQAKFKLNGYWYVIDFADMKQKQSNNLGRSRAVKREVIAPATSPFRPEASPTPRIPNATSLSQAVTPTPTANPAPPLPGSATPSPSLRVVPITPLTLAPPEPSSHAPVNPATLATRAKLGDASTNPFRQATTRKCKEAPVTSADDSSLKRPRGQTRDAANATRKSTDSLPPPKGIEDSEAESRCNTSEGRSGGAEAQVASAATGATPNNGVIQATPDEEEEGAATQAAGDALASGTPNNEKIHAMLIELGEIEKAKGDSIRAGSYYKAARAVRAHPVDLQSGKEARQLQGIGPKIAEKIDELLATGGLKRLDRERDEPRNRALLELQRVSGIGPKTAQALYDEHGIRDLAMLAANTALLDNAQKIGLKYVRDFEQRIPRDEMRHLFGYVERAVMFHNPPLKSQPCGSFRRGCPDSGDLDVLIFHPSFTTFPEDACHPFKDPIGLPPSEWLRTIVQNLKNEGFITDVISLGPTKCAAVCRLPPDLNAVRGQGNVASPTPATPSSQAAASPAPGHGGIASPTPATASSQAAPSNIGSPIHGTASSQAAASSIASPTPPTSSSQPPAPPSSSHGSHAAGPPPSAPTLPNWKAAIARRAAASHVQVLQLVSPDTVSPDGCSSERHESGTCRSLFKALRCPQHNLDMFESWRAERQQPSEAASQAEPPATSTAGPSSYAAPPDFLAPLSETNFMIGQDAGVKDSTTVVEQPHRRIDIRLVPYDCLHYATLYFTGSDELNRRMRQAAIDRGYKLSEYYLMRMENGEEVGLPVKVDCEKDIFDMLGFKFLPPTRRNI